MANPAKPFYLFNPGPESLKGQFAGRQYVFPARKIYVIDPWTMENGQYVISPDAPDSIGGHLLAQLRNTELVEFDPEAQALEGADEYARGKIIEGYQKFVTAADEQMETHNRRNDALVQAKLTPQLPPPSLRKMIAKRRQYAEALAGVGLQVDAPPEISIPTFEVGDIAIPKSKTPPRPVGGVDGDRLIDPGVTLPAPADKPAGLVIPPGQKEQLETAQKMKEVEEAKEPVTADQDF